MKTTKAEWMATHKFMPMHTDFGNWIMLGRDVFTRDEDRFTNGSLLSEQEQSSVIQQFQPEFEGKWTPGGR